MAGPKPLNASRENMALAEQFFGQVSDSIQMVFDLTSRIDERVKILIERQNELDDRLHKITEYHQSSVSRLAIIESKEYPLLKEDLTKIKENMNTITQFQEEIEEIQTKLRSAEMKLEMASLKIGTNENRWMVIFDAIWKMGLMLVAGYILYKLGLQAPPVP